MLMEQLIVALPIYLRFFGFVMLLPFEAGLNAWLLRCSLALGASLYALPIVQSSAQLSALALISEIAYGALLALPLALLLEVVSGFGELFDSARGQNVSDLLDPLHAQSSSRSAVLLNVFCWAALLQTGFLLDAFVRLQGSFEQVPLGTFFDGVLLNLLPRLVDLTLFFACGVLELFMPLAAVFFLVELALGWLGKALPTASLYAEALMIKSAFGLICLDQLNRMGAFSVLDRLASVNLVP